MRGRTLRPAPRAEGDATGLPGLGAADSEVLIRRLLREAVVVPADQTARGPADG